MLPSIDEKSTLLSPGGNPTSPLSNMPVNSPTPINTNLDTGRPKLTAEDLKNIPDNLREGTDMPPKNAKDIPVQSNKMTSEDLKLLPKDILDTYNGEPVVPEKPAVDDTAPE